MKTPDRWSLHVILKGNLDQDLLAYSLNSSPGPKPIMHYGSSFYEFMEVKWGFLLLCYIAKKEKPRKKNQRERKQPQSHLYSAAFPHPSLLVLLFQERDLHWILLILLLSFNTLSYMAGISPINSQCVFKWSLFH